MFVYAADHASTSVISARMTVYTTVCTVVYLSVFCRKGILEMARMSHRGHSFIMDGRLFMRKKKEGEEAGSSHRREQSALRCLHTNQTTHHHRLICPRHDTSTTQTRRKKVKVATPQLCQPTGQRWQDPKLTEKA